MPPVVATGSRALCHAPHHGVASGRNVNRGAVPADRRQYRDDPLLRTNQDVAYPSAHRERPRVYGSYEARTLAFIRRSRELGFSPDQIRTLLRLWGYRVQISALRPTKSNI